MSDKDNNRRAANKFQSLGKSEKEMVLYLVYAGPPVSIDTLISLSGENAFDILNVIERLINKKIVCEKKGYGKGLYFLNGNDIAFADFIQEHMSEEENRNALINLIDYYSQHYEDGNEKILILAQLYCKLGDIEGGSKHIKNAADILIHSGDHEKAFGYYEYIVKSFIKNESLINHINVDDFLESIIKYFSKLIHHCVIDEHIPIMEKAQKIAKHYQRWEHLVRIKICMARLFGVTRNGKYLSKYINDCLTLARNSDNPHVLRMASLWISENLCLRGRFKEAVNCYKEAIGDLEAFGEDPDTLISSTIVAYAYIMCGNVARGMGMLDTVRDKGISLNLPGVIFHADIGRIYALLEMRKFDEAESWLDRVRPFTDNKNPRQYRLSPPLNGAKAFILCARGDYNTALEYCKREKDSLVERFGPKRYNTTAWDLECLDILESKGFFHEDFDPDLEIDKFIKQRRNIYLKGVALRYRALRNKRKQEVPSDGILLDLKKSEKYLKRSDAQIELARTRIALGSHYLEKGKEKGAGTYIGKAWAFFSVVDKGLFPQDLLAIISPEQKMEVFIDRITKINESLGTIQEKSAFLEMVINVAMDFCMATRGAFFILEPGDELEMIASRGLDPSLFNTDRFRPIKQIIFDAAREGRQTIILGVKQSDKASDKLLREAGISSLICMAATLDKKTHGYLYLDNWIGGDLLPNSYLPFVRMLCSQIAIGMSNIDIYEKMRNLKDRFEDEAVFYKREMGIASPVDIIIGKSEGIQKVIHRVRTVAATDSSVLITGETGVGKEIVAKVIHNLSERKDGPFIPVNIASLPHELVTSELFGYEKGAFTGANKRYRGRFELADKGTIFLDEIGDLPLDLQVKLLRVLQEGIFERLGGAKQIQSDFRIISATNKDLHYEVETGAFREDLYYRLNVFPINVLPLRDRKEDIPLIASHYLDIFGKKMGKRMGRVRSAEMNKLIKYNWPGNVRELKHFIERTVILANGQGIRFKGLQNGMDHRISGEEKQLVPLADMERAYIIKALNATLWRVKGPSGAASILGLKPTTLFSRMKKLDIKKPSIGHPVERHASHDKNKGVFMLCV